MEQHDVKNIITAPYVVEQLNRIQEVCEEYGLYAKIVNYKNGYSVLGTGVYVVVSMYPIPDNIKPYKLCDRNERNNQVFYPKNFAVKLTPDNPVVAFDSIIQFCKKSEFLRALYKEFDAELPECVRYTELTGLENWNEGRYNDSMGAEYQLKCFEGLETFFKQEKKKNKTAQEKRRFWRSDKYDERASWFQKQSDFNNRNEPVVRLNVLLQYTDDVNKLEMPEEYYASFLDYLKKCYPEVTIAADEKETIDNGLIALSKKLPKDHPAMRQKPITAAEFNEIMRRNFATQGWKCVEEYQPAKWEYRNIYYKEVDEPQIIAAFNDISLEFADPEPMQTMKERGKCCMVDLSITDFRNFVALAKQNHLLFHVDNTGKFAMPSLENIHVVYNVKDQNIVDTILSTLVKEKVLRSHLLYQEQLKYAPTLRRV